MRLRNVNYSTKSAQLGEVKLSVWVGQRDHATNATRSDPCAFRNKFWFSNVTRPVRWLLFYIYLIIHIVIWCIILIKWSCKIAKNSQKTNVARGDWGVGEVLEGLVRWQSWTRPSLIRLGSCFYNLEVFSKSCGEVSSRIKYWWWT